MFSLCRGFSGYLIVGVENFDIANNSISGFSNAGGKEYSVRPRILYIKNGFI